MYFSISLIRCISSKFAVYILLLSYSRLYSQRHFGTYRPTLYKETLQMETSKCGHMSHMTQCSLTESHSRFRERACFHIKHNSDNHIFSLRQRYSIQFIPSNEGSLSVITQYKWETYVVVVLLWEAESLSLDCHYLTSSWLPVFIITLRYCTIYCTENRNCV